uniref:Uncharacterized protein n=1 Tax=Chromera velia CCMP2878 TaxID=1169474 RepID=A0A0G4HZN4_9ALVE|mmetsp:Transcript_17658/g.35830  ORF Transcript_17658/g.35830 Transcript_17658/m.35830 type:complete len:357 (+) Transcript_17658:234-1304(+)|eukprot:Cvel_1569.t1-p1 / transcript=Cvel_1569.t1 / gene=Cvel_1569 / organism=Chromera_velia_CCMP2878 / gene_product=1-aminocyclopropane-1-carboxylate oxidase, putative / transcript_product=1-aminocyclopropane-1-carboxylate oxidase, putative / location=Cvel_scaffold56:14478-18526(+) / protein_length=356 / sequence_SO=supercontig / SO=protein_coding / is_pseudo=false
MSAEQSGVPVIDLSPLQGADVASRQELARQVSDACMRVGFFYIENHGVPPEVVEAALSASRSFFALASEKKETVAAQKSPLYRGYISQETGSHSCTPEKGRKDHKESFTVGAPIPPKAEGDGPSASPMHGENQWPETKNLPEFREAIQTFWIKLMDAARLVARALALSLCLDENFFAKSLQDPCAQMVLLRYPGTGKALGGEGETDAAEPLGCGAHTDCGFLTLLAQDSVPGLEVMLREGVWIPAPPRPGCFVVNLGDMAEMWTGKLYRSTWHRVHNGTGLPRYSIPFFCNCDFYTVVASLENAGAKAAAPVPPEVQDQLCRYEPVTAGRYILEKLGLMYLQPQEEGKENSAASVT